MQIQLSRSFTQRIRVKRLYERLQALPWPALAAAGSDLALYDTLLAGCAHRVHGQLLELSTVPYPDQDTLRVVDEFRAKATPSAEEREFLTYFEVLERIRSALGKY